MPSEQRDVLLKENGHWAVFVASLPTTELLRAVRTCLGFSMANISSLKDRLPGILASGTRGEMEVLIHRLNRSAGVQLPVEVIAVEREKKRERG